MTPRFWEIDCARGIAVIGMILFNWSFALAYFGVIASDGNWWYWWVFPRVVAGMFIVIAGISFAISWQRLPASSKRRFPVKYLKRGLLLLVLGGGITIATAVFVPAGTIYFGILHFMGAAILLAPLLVRMHRWLAVFGIACLLAGVIMSNVSISSPWLLWLGIVPQNFMTFDYFPLLPWLGIFALGMYGGLRWYHQGVRGFQLPSAGRGTVLIEFLGRHSLTVYIVHQPLLLGALAAVGLLMF